jgi:hypothetical protein
MWPFSWLKRRSATREAKRKEQAAAELGERAISARARAEAASAEAGELRDRANRKGFVSWLLRPIRKRKARKAEAKALAQHGSAERAEREARGAEQRAEESHVRVENLSGPREQEPPLRELMWFSRPSNCCEAHLLREKPSLIPRSKGVYAWYFNSLPLGVPREEYIRVDGFDLLYIGIAGSPSRPDSRNTLRSRIIDDHLRGDAIAPSLRLSLGTFLKDHLGLTLKLRKDGYVWSNEGALTEWICQNALVAWVEKETPWVEERWAIKNYGKFLPFWPFADSGGTKHA